MAGGGGHDRPIIVPALIVPAMRGGHLIRRGYAVLIAAAITIVLFHEFTTQFGSGHEGHLAGLAVRGDDVVWALPAVALGAAVGAGLVVASGSRVGHTLLERLHLPGLGRDSRARSIGLVWGSIGVLAVHFTGAAFEAVPGGHSAVAIVVGGGLGYGTYRLHHHAMRHEAYRTFNLVAMLLAAGSLASMSITPTGEWWNRNFSTLGTSDDIAAACFNIAVAVSGAGMAGMSGALTRALLAPRFGVRRGGLLTMRLLIVVIGASLVGVGLVPIDGDTDLHNAAALSAATAFAVLCVGVQLWARTLPRALVVASYASIALEVTAMVLYDVAGLFNLTVFEVVAFTLVFAWLIALVAITHAEPPAPDASSRRHVVPTRRARRARARHHAAARGPRTAAQSGSPPRRFVPVSAGSGHRAGVQRDLHALRRGAEGADEPSEPG